MQLYHLMYHSCSTLAGGEGTPLRDLGALLEHCLVANPARQITGALALDDRRFLQVIEGPEAAVDRLYAAILRDRRHRGIELVLREPCERRRFESWSMAFAYRDPRLPLVFGDVAAGRTRERALATIATLAEIVTSR